MSCFDILIELLIGFAFRRWSLRCDKTLVYPSSPLVNSVRHGSRCPQILQIRFARPLGESGGVASTSARESPENSTARLSRVQR